MWRPFIAAALLLAAVVPASAQSTYQTTNIKAAQEALVRLGYDPGPVDGKWSKPTGVAMNALREANGLPAAKAFSGSSLELIHRLSPGATTLPKPGILISDPVGRRTFIAGLHETDKARALCQGPVGPDDEELSKYLDGAPPAKVTTSSSPSLGYITRDEDWYTPVIHAVMASHNACIAGDDASCSNVVAFMSKWAAADALKPGAKRNQKAFEDISWIGNSLLRNLTFAYADARKLVKVAPADDAAILDWLKQRIDEYHYIIPSGNPVTSINYTEASNHALADMMPAMAFGAMVGDRPMMEDAFKTYRVALDSMRDDGSLPTETRRGARSLHYSSFQLSQLLATEEVARTQGIDLTVDDAITGKTIPKAVTFMLDALENFDKVTPYAKANVGAGPSADYKLPFFKPLHMGWLPAYFARYGNDDNMKRMVTFKFDARACSKDSVGADKFPQQACALGVPSMRKFLSVWETSDVPYMGYSAFCLQGVALKDWPLH